MSRFAPLPGFGPTRYFPGMIEESGAMGGGMAAQSPVDAGGDLLAPVRHHMPNHVPVPTPRAATGMFGAKPRSRGQMIAGIFGDFMAGMGGRQGQFAQTLAAERERETERQRQEAIWQREDARYQQRRTDELNAPKFFETNGDYRRYDPATNKVETLYDAPDKPRDAYRWRANDGSLMEIGADGSPKVVYDDPTPRQQFIPDGMGGGQWVAQPQSAPAVRPPVGAVISDPRKAGGAGSGPGTFR